MCIGLHLDIYYTKIIDVWVIFIIYMNTIKLMDLVTPAENLKQLNSGQKNINDMVSVLAHDPDKVQKILGVLGIPNKLSESNLKNSRLLRKLALMLVASGITISDLKADNFTEKLLANFKSKETQQTTPPVAVMLSPNDVHAYNKAAGQNVGKPYEPKVAMNKAPNVSKPSANVSSIQDYVEKMANIVYKQEGGIKTKYPYGIMIRDKSGNIKKYSEPEARKIAIRTIKRLLNLWDNYSEKGKRETDFVSYVAETWCPPRSLDKFTKPGDPRHRTDPTGYNNWIAGVNKMLYREYRITNEDLIALLSNQKSKI